MSVLIDSIYNKRNEVHYNEMPIYERSPIKMNLQGKIKCPVLNYSISSVTCSKLMEREGWPRSINKDICKDCSCYVYVSIQKFNSKKVITDGKSTS
jgi:hypothetical protein